MTHHPLITGILLGAAVALCLICALGLVVARDAYQRLQCCSPITSLAIWLIAVAVWVESSEWQARIKVVLIALTLFVMNAILSHATARAIRIRQMGHWEPRQEEKIPVVNAHGIAGSPAFEDESLYEPKGPP